MKERCKKIIRY